MVFLGLYNHDTEFSYTPFRFMLSIAMMMESVRTDHIHFFQILVSVLVAKSLVKKSKMVTWSCLNIIIPMEDVLCLSMERVQP